MQLFTKEWKEQFAIEKKQPNQKPKKKKKKKEREREVIKENLACLSSWDAFWLMMWGHCLNYQRGCTDAGWLHQLEVDSIS